MVPHTVIVDFAVALLLTSVACDLLAAAAEDRELRTVAAWTLWFGGAAAALSVLSGFAAASAADPAGEALRIVNLHRNIGIATLATALPLAFWRFRSGAEPPAHPGYWLLTALLTAAVMTTAYLGGTSVFQYGVGVVTGS